MGLFGRMLLPKKRGPGKRVPKKGKGGLGKTETADGKTNASRVPKKKKGKGGLGKTKTAGGKTNASRVLPKKGKGRLGKTDSSLQLATPLARKFEPPNLWTCTYNIYYNHDECVKDEKMARDLEYKYLFEDVLGVGDCNE